MIRIRREIDTFARILRQVEQLLPAVRLVERPEAVDVGVEDHGGRFWILDWILDF